MRARPLALPDRDSSENQFARWSSRSPDLGGHFALHGMDHPALGPTNLSLAQTVLRRLVARDVCQRRENAQHIWITK